ncbi:MAG: hypothetical protein AAF915_20670 [Cyanobacteria bacterium P01_D01_bin.50]
MNSFLAVTTTKSSNQGVVSLWFYLSPIKYFSANIAMWKMLYSNNKFRNY